MIHRQPTRFAARIPGAILLLTQFAYGSAPTDAPQLPDARLIEHLRAHPGDRSCRQLLSNLSGPVASRGFAKRVKFHARYRTPTGENRMVFVFDPVVRTWPGWQPETIVITDTQCRPVAWREVGGGPMFQEAELGQDKARAPVLILTRRHRHTYRHPAIGKYRFSLSEDGLRDIPMVEWVYANDRQRDVYEQRRQLPDLPADIY